MESIVNGAEHLLSSMAHNGIDICFANPGTSEMHFTAAIEKQQQVRGVLVLEEGVATGAADGFARIAKRPASTLLHLGPGLANGLSNLHNAIRARSGILNIVGDHATYHKDLDAPLNSDIEGAARPFSNWVRTSRSPELIAHDAADAIGAAQIGQIATLILPADVAWNRPAIDTAPAPQAVLPATPDFDEHEIEAAARLLRLHGRRSAILMGGLSLQEEQLALAAEISGATGARLLSDTFVPIVERGFGRHSTEKIPYRAPAAQTLLSDFDTIILVDTQPPVAFFAYPGTSSVLAAPGTSFITIAPKRGKSLEPLQLLRDAVVPPGSQRPHPQELAHTGMPSGTIDSEKLQDWICQAIPEHSIVIDEIGTAGPQLFQRTAGAQSHDLIVATGGSIGYALPCAVGASTARPGTPVIVLQADGSAMYKVQALWTQAREQLPVITLVMANRRYQTLRNELQNVGAGELLDEPSDLLDIDRPAIDWTAMASAMGVPGTQVTTVEELENAYRKALGSGGPAVIEIRL